MSRTIVGKVWVRGDLVAKTPISVGGLGDGEHVDLDVAVDGAGRFYIPGTSLAGPMRAWLSENVESEKLLDTLFGFIEQARDGGQASFLFIEDSPAQGVARERRHGIALRADTGTVADGFFYTRGLLPRGTRFPLEMELDIDKSSEPGTEHPAGTLALLLKAMCEGKVRFGACKTRGMGELRLEDLRVDYYDFAGNSGDLDRWLASGGSSEDRRGLGLEQELKALECFGTPKRREQRLFEVLIHWRALSPIMVKAGRDGVEADMLPLMSGVEGAKDAAGGIAPVLPGSSVKGALRAQARRILHTLFDPNGENASEKPEYLNLLDALFGSTEWAGRLSVDDVYYRPEAPVSPDAWLKEDANALNAVTERHQHVAIDRFTGGASEGALYSTRPVKRDERERESGWEPIRLALDLSDFPEAEGHAALALLKLLVRDLEDGYVSIGFGSRRGMGEIAVEGVDWDVGFPADEKLQTAWDAFVDGGGAFHLPQFPKEETKHNV